MIRIVNAREKATAQEAFLCLPAKIYANDRYYIPDFTDSVRKNVFLNAASNQFVPFVAENNEKAVARCLAGINPDKTAYIGFFEAENNPAACKQLMNTAEKWLVQQGAKTILGPMNGNTWQSYRFTDGPWEIPPFLKEPWNPPYYKNLWQQCGYQIVDRYTSSRIKTPQQAANKLKPYLKRVSRNGYTFRNLRIESMDSELAIMHRLASAIFAENRHYSPINLRDFMQLYAGTDRLLRPGLCQFCCDRNGQECGFVFCYPDYAESVRAMRGSRGPLAVLRFLLNKRKARRVCIKSLGTLPEFRGTGIAPALMCRAFEQTAAYGYDEALMCLMHQNNDSRRLDGSESEVIRNYVLLQKQCG